MALRRPSRLTSYAVAPLDAAHRTCTWSHDSAVAVTPVGAGRTVVTVTGADGADTLVLRTVATA